MSAVAAVAAAPLSVLVVDDDERIVALFSAVLADACFAVTGVTDHDAAYAALDREQFDLAILDLNISDGSGLEIADVIARTAPETAVMVVTGVDNRRTAARARERGADAYLVKPVSPRQLLICIDELLSLGSRRESQGRVARRGEIEAFERLVKIAAVRDAETGVHSDSMSARCEALGLALGVGELRAQTIGRASRLHDVGKIGIADAILHKPGALNDDERREIEKHPAIGWTLLSGSDDPVLDLAATIALSHHERWDGAGYPHGLVGDEIPFEARIAAVCDVFDALLSDRPYRNAFPHSDALALIERGSGTAFDPAVVRAFLCSTAAEQRIGCGS